MQTVFQGKESYKQLADILKTLSFKKFLLVCGKNSFDALNIQEFIDTECPEYIRFSEFSPNPKYEQVCKGIEAFNVNDCKAIVAIGGGSAIDVAKCIKLFCKMDSSENYLKQEFIDTGIPLIAIPTTAGTGSESTRFAVIYYKDEKQSVDHRSIVPDFAILDSSLLKSIPLYHKKSAMLDALCQGIESWWSVNSSDESKEYSKTAVGTIMQNWRQYILDGDENAAEQIMIASNYAGRAINITQTTAPHAFSYKITSVYNISHGHAVAISLPIIWEYMIANLDKCIDKRGADYLLNIFIEIAAHMGYTSPEQAIVEFHHMMKQMDLYNPVRENVEELECLVQSVNVLRMKNHPVILDEIAIKSLYEAIVL